MSKPLSQRQITKKATKARREDMAIKVLSFNIQQNKLSKSKKSFLKLLNNEAKYYYNFLIKSSESIVDDYGFYVKPIDLFKFITKSNHITVFWNGDYIDYELRVLTSQMKQEILQKIQASIKGLSKRKGKGHKVGKLKFKSVVNVPLKQFQFTYYLSDDAKKLKLQGNRKQSFHLIKNKNLTKLAKGLKLDAVSLSKLIDLGAIELANAEIVGDKFNLTVYFNKEALEKAKLFQGSRLPELKSVQVGIDAGIKSELTINVNEQHASIEIDTRCSPKLKKLKRYQRKFNRHISKCKKNKTKVKTGKYWDLNDKINALHTDVVNSKIDNVNKLVSLFKECKQVTFQNEMIKSWHSNKAFGFSQKVQLGMLGKLYAKLKVLSKDDPQHFKMLSRSLRTTKTCICGNVNHDMGLKDRVYACSCCGYLNDRDTHSSYIINNTVNYEGCGKQPQDQKSKHDLVLDSNLGKTIATVTTARFKTVLDNKLKSKNLRSALNHFKRNTLEAPAFTQG